MVRPPRRPRPPSPRCIVLDAEPVSVWAALRWIALHPWQAVGRRWNYKAAILSSILRASVFFTTHLSAGGDAALAAMTTEFCFRFATSGFHGVSHHGEAPAQILNLAKINKYHVQMVAHLADRLSRKQEGDGTLLDHSLILYGSNMGNSNQHVHYDVPHVLVGGAGGKLKGGRHLAYPSKTVPTGNLLLSVLDRFDIHQDSIGDSTGRLEDL